MRDSNENAFSINQSQKLFQNKQISEVAFWMLNSQKQKLTPSIMSAVCKWKFLSNTVITVKSSQISTSFLRYAKGLRIPKPTF